MDLYNTISLELAKLLTNKYSTSFSMSSRLFGLSIRADIYNIYGFVRVADEIVDTYKGKDSLGLLTQFHHEALGAISRGYSTNPIVHAFAVTAIKYGITDELIKPFIESMKTDLTPHSFNKAQYDTYIYGSAEVVGLMCLKVFTGGDDALYIKLRSGAMALGSAFQKVNFLRDYRADYEQLGRVYFPGVTFDNFTNKQKKSIEEDIQNDFISAKQAINELPRSARTAVLASYFYYQELFNKLQRVSPEDLKVRRYRISNWRKVTLMVKAYFTYG